MTYGWATAGVAVAFAVLASWYSVLVPVLEAPDEPPHVLYVVHLMQGRGLPVLSATGRDNFAGQESVQPPLYYAAAAIASFWTDPSDFASWQLTNWHQNVERDRPGNKNLIVHTDRERFPWTGSILTIHVIRLVSVAFATLAIVATIGAAREFGLAPVTAVLTGAFIAAIPQVAFIGGTVNSDNAAFATAAAGLWVAIRIIRRGPSDRLLMLAGVVGGLAAIAKLSGAIVLPLLLVAWWLGRRNGPIIRGLLLIGVPAAITGGWWYLRNLLTYGDPLGWSRMLLDIESIVRRQFTAADLIAELAALHDSLWAVFGWRNVAFDSWVYLVFDAIALAGGIGAVLLLRGSPHRRLFGFLALWIAAYLVALGRWMVLVEHTGQGRLLLPAYPAAAILIVGGLAAIWPRRPLVPVAAVALLALVSIAAPLTVILPAYPAPPRVAAASEVGTPVRATFGDRVELVGYRVEPTFPRPGGDAWLVMTWRSVRPVQDDLDINIRLLARDFRPILEEARYPALGAYPFLLWTPGETIEDRRPIRLPASLEAPDYLFAELSVRPRERIDDRLPIADPAGKPAGDRLLIGPLRVQSAGGWPPAGYQSFDSPVAAGMWLRGARIDRVDPPESLIVTLAWDGAPIADRRRVVVSLQDSAGRTISSSDAEPGDGWYRTDRWQTGDRILDDRDLALPARLGSGSYRLVVSVIALDGSPIAGATPVAIPVTLP